MKRTIRAWLLALGERGFIQRLALVAEMMAERQRTGWQPDPEIRKGSAPNVFRRNLGKPREPQFRGGSGKNLFAGKFDGTALIKLRQPGRLRNLQHNMGQT